MPDCSPNFFKTCLQQLNASRKLWIAKCTSFLLINLHFFSILSFCSYFAVPILWSVVWGGVKKCQASRQASTSINKCLTFLTFKRYRYFVSERCMLFIGVKTHTLTSEMNFTGLLLWSNVMVNSKKLKDIHSFCCTCHLKNWKLKHLWKKWIQSNAWFLWMTILHL